MILQPENSPSAAPNDFTTRLIAAHEAGNRFVPEGPVPETSDEALAVQQAVMDRFGPPAAFKVANKAGAPFVMAPIRADRIFQSGAAVPIVDRAGIELEIGFEILSPLPATDDRAALVACLRPLPVIEVVDTRIAGPHADRPFVKLADQQANGALVIGQPAEGWTGQDFSGVRGRLTCGTTSLLDGQATVPGGSALALVAELATRIGTHCGGLKPGQIVITGSLNGLPFVGTGSDIQGEIEGLGSLSFSLTGR